MDIGMDKGVNIIILANKYLKVNIKMDIEMGKEVNIIIMNN